MKIRSVKQIQSKLRKGDHLTLRSKIAKRSYEKSVRLEKIVSEVMSKSTMDVTMKRLQAILVKEYKLRVAIPKLNKVAKTLGERYKPTKVRQLHVDSPANVESRRFYAKQIITLLELRPDIVIYQYDETGFNSTSTKRWGWVNRLKPVPRIMQRFETVTLTSTVSSEGRNYFNLLTGSNCALAFIEWMKQLEKRLDYESPNWRGNSIILGDNASIHKDKRCIQHIR
jgi:transposase